MDFSRVNEMTIPEGTVKQIAVGNNIVWKNYKAFPKVFEGIDIASIPQAVDGHPLFNGSRLSFAKLEGKTKKYNQLIPISAYQSSTTVNGITFTKNGDGTITVNGTATDGASFISSTFTNISGHSYLLIGCPSGGSATLYSLSFGEGYKEYGSGLIIPNDATVASRAWNIEVYAGTTVSNLVFKPQFVDLTAIYGSGNEPTTVEQFLSDYPAFNDYVPYTEGALKSVEASGIRVNGANLWDEEWENGRLSETDGSVIAASSTIVSKNFISILPNTKYFFKHEIGVPQRACYYDKNKQFIAFVDQIATTIGGNAFTTYPNAYYYKFYLNTPTYNHDIAIVLGTTGTYTPYRAPFLLEFGQTVSIDGIGDVKDEIRAVKQSNGTWNLELVKRIGEVDLGTLWFQSMTYGGHTLFYTQNQSQVPNTTNYICSIYNTVGGITNMPDLSITGAGGTGASIWIRDDSCATAQDLQTKLNSVSLKYRLNNSTITTLYTGLTDDDISTSVDVGGTIGIVGNENEEFVKPTLTVDLDAKKITI